GAKEPKKARKFKKPASPKLKTVSVSPKELTKKPAKKLEPAKKVVLAMKSSRKSQAGVIIKDTPSVSVSKTETLTKGKRSKGDGTDFESRVPNKQQRKISGTDEGTGTKPGVPDVPKYDSGSEKESWGDSGEENDDDEDDNEDESDNDGNDDDGDNDGNDDDRDNDDNDDDNDNERTESDRDENPNPNQYNEEHDEKEEEYVDKRVHTPDKYELTDEEDNANYAKEENVDEEDDAEELYRDINVNLRKKDVEMTDTDQGRADQHNVSEESGFEHVDKDAHVTLTAVHNTQKTEGPMQSSSVSSDFTNKLLNFKNTSSPNNEIASLMDTTVRHEKPSSQISSLYIILITVIPEIKFVSSTTIPPAPPPFNPLPQHATPTPTPTTSEATTLFPALLDFSSVFKFNDRSSSQPKSTYVAVATLSEFELTKILMDKMEEHKSYQSAEYKKELYDALVKSYNTDKDLFETYGEVFTLKQTRDEKDKDQEPSAGSDRGTKRRKSSKEAESSRDLRSKESKSSSSSKGTSRTQHKPSGKSAHAKEPRHTVDDSRVQQNQEFDTGNNDEQPDVEAASRHNWFE
ncbi:hypothetical protein Tco_0884473, partial [Tanacetum coccineum]